MYEERRWGTALKTLDCSAKEYGVSLTKKVTLLKVCRPATTIMSSIYDELWAVLSGKAEMIVEGKVLILTEGPSARIKEGQKHAVKAIEEFVYIEIHLGEIPGEVDMHRITFDWETTI